MRRSIHFLEYLFCLLLLVFCVGRIGFMAYNADVETFGVGDAMQACWHGLLSHDLFVTAFLLVVPWLVSLLALRMNGKLPLRAVLIPYYIILGIAVGTIIVADAVMYEFWQFKLSAVVLSYASSPEGTTNSVSLGFLLTRLAVLLLFWMVIIVPCILFTPRRLENDRPTRLWFRNLSIIWAFLLMAGALLVRVGDAYYSRKLFLNHATTNSVYAFAASFPMEKDYGTKYRSEVESSGVEEMSWLYPADLTDVADTLLTTQRPNILFVLIESFGGKFVKELGGVPGVAPEWSRLIPEGVFWENYYSNSFRTDRGTVSAYSGWLSYPTVSLMTHAEWHHRLPSLAKSLAREGYATSYLYAGAMTNMGKRTYLQNMEFHELLDETAFSPDELTSSWGADDSTSAMKVFHLISQKDTARWFVAYQTLSSHEPWQVPYHRLEDEKLNAFAYTDHCLGQLIDSLRTLPAWDDMLVILMPDHGFLYEQSYEDPEFFHSPMLWIGGAVRSPRRMSVLMNQSDVAATLLSQMGIGHADFPWSRNVLSRGYVYPFAYCNFPAGFLFCDSTGVSIFDITADETIFEAGDTDGHRQQVGKAILSGSGFGPSPKGVE